MKAVGPASDGIPFVIGVSGHRDIPAKDIPEIKETVRNVLSEIQATLPNTPLRLLSPFAEGADRIVAQVALEQGIEVVGVLPVPAADYESDFDTPESVQEFRGLLQQAKSVVVVPFVHQDRVPKGLRQKDPRAIQYALAGALVAENCQLLIALWDGEDTGKLGGTWQVVQFMLKGIPVGMRIHGDLLSQEELGDVIHISVDRASHAKPSQPVSAKPKLRVLSVCGDDLESADVTSIGQAPTLRQAQRTFEKFNRTVANGKLTNGNAAQRQEAEEPSRVGHGTPTWQDSAQRVAEHFAIADQLAIRLQAVYLKAWAAILCLSFAAAITLQVHLNAVGGWVLSVIYGGLIVVAFSVYYAVKRLRIEEQYLDYRALAEGLRIQTHWLEGGLADPVARFYLHRQHSELKWIRSAIRNWTFSQTHLHAASDARADINERISAISTEWLSGQRAHFSKAASKARRSERIWTWAARLLVVVGVLLAVIKSAFDPSPWLVVLVAAPPILVAILTLHVQNRKFGPLSQQATRMAALFDCAVMRLQDIRDTPDGLSDDFDELLRQLGREVLAENAEWVILHRDRPISTPFVA